MRRPPIDTSRRFPGGAPICPARAATSARPALPANSPAVAPATCLRNPLRSGIVLSLHRLAALAAFSKRSERELGAEFGQSPAHDLYRVHELVIGVAVPRLLVEDGARVEDVIEVDIPLQPALPQREDPAETEIQLRDPIVEDRVGRNQRDRAVGGTRGG